MRAWGVAAILAVCGGCSVFVGDDQSEPDATPACFEAPTTTLFDASALDEPTLDLRLTESGVYTLDFNLGTLRFEDQSMVVFEDVEFSDPVAMHVLLVREVVIGEGAILQANGTTGGLVLAASSTVRIDGLLDLSANGTLDNPRIPAGSGLKCVDAAGLMSGPRGENGLAGADEPEGGGGGGGGVLYGAGGSGGRGNIEGTMMGGGGLAGFVSVPADTLAGGCRGGRGGNIGSAGGLGAGAVAIVSGCDIEISGAIHANGQGGQGGSAAKRGGGGGGSGGMIWLEAPTIRLASTAVLSATGGGGGGGAGQTQSTGEPGENGMPTTDPASGGAGAGAVNTGSGGDGSIDFVQAGGTGKDGDGGGGGGGGGPGLIVLEGDTSGSQDGFLVLPTPVPTN